MQLVTVEAPAIQERHATEVHSASSELDDLLGDLSRERADRGSYSSIYVYICKHANKYDNRKHLSLSYS